MPASNTEIRTGRRRRRRVSSLISEGEEGLDWMLWRNFDRGLPLISKLPPAAGQLWEASAMCSAPLPGLSLLYPHTPTCLHPVRCTHPCTYTPLIPVIKPTSYVLPIHHVPCLSLRSVPSPLGRQPSFFCVGPRPTTL